MSSDEEFYDLYNRQYGLTVDEVKNLREEWFIHKPDDDVSNVQNCIIWMRLLLTIARKGKGIIRARLRKLENQKYQQDVELVLEWQQNQRQRSKHN